MKVIDLFCGAGGFSEGFELAGFKIILGIDNWQLACDSFKLNHPNAKVQCMDIADVNPGNLPKAEIIIGSPPCKEFTSLNLKKQPYRGMINVCHFLRIVDKYKPKYWLMENVLGVQKYIPSYLPRFKLKASNFGCASGRHRLFVGNLSAPFSMGINPHPKRTLVGIDNRNKAKSKIIDVDGIKVIGDEKERKQLLANAVPPLLAKAVAETIKIEMELK